MAAQREWLEKDYYEVLGVARTATDKEITRAYRKLAKQFHPDANPGAEDRFKEISAAYDVLGDAAKRKEYDEVRRLGAAGFPGWVGAGRLRRARVAPPSAWRTSATSGTSSAGMFGGGGRTRRRRRAAARCRRRDRAPPVVRGRRARGDHVGERGRRGPLRDLPRIGRGAGHDPGDLPAL